MTSIFQRITRKLTLTVKGAALERSPKRLSDSAIRGRVVPDKQREVGPDLYSGLLQAFTESHERRMRTFGERARGWFAGRRESLLRREVTVGGQLEERVDRDGPIPEIQADARYHRHQKALRQATPGNESSSGLIEQ